MNISKKQTDEVIELITISGANALLHAMEMKRPMEEVQKCRDTLDGMVEYVKVLHMEVMSLQAAVASLMYNDLKKTEVVITDESLEDLIEVYTLRLERELGKITFKLMSEEVS